MFHQPGLPYRSVTKDRKGDHILRPSAVAVTRVKKGRLSGGFSFHFIPYFSAYRHGLNNESTLFAPVRKSRFWRRSRIHALCRLL